MSEINKNNINTSKVDVNKLVDKIENSNLSQDQKKLLEAKINDINKLFDLYKKDFPEVEFLQKQFDQKLKNIDTILDNKELNSDTIMSILSKEWLISTWVVSVEKWDTAGKLAYSYNINPQKLFLDGNTDLKEWTTELLRAESTIVIKLKKLEKEWIITFGKDDIPTLKNEIPLWKQLEILELMDDYINIQLAKKWEKADPKMIEAKKQIEEIKLKYSKELTNKLHENENKLKTNLEKYKTQNTSPDYINNSVLEDLYRYVGDEKVDLWERIIMLTLIAEIIVVIAAIAWTSAFVGILEKTATSTLATIWTMGTQVITRWWQMLDKARQVVNWKALDDMLNFWELIKWDFTKWPLEAMGNYSLFLRIIVTIQTEIALLWKGLFDKYPNVTSYLAWFMPNAGKMELDKWLGFNAQQTWLFHLWRFSKDILEVNSLALNRLLGDVVSWIKFEYVKQKS